MSQILKKIGGTHVTVQVEKEVFVSSRFNSSFHHHDGQHHGNGRKQAGRAEGQTTVKGVVAT